MQIAPHLSELIEQVYLGVIEDPPWDAFFSSLREQLGAHTVSLLLCPPGDETQVAMLTSGGRLSEIENYNHGQFVLDPFVNLPTGDVIALHEFLTTEALLASEFYQVVMEPQGWYDFLGADLRDSEGLDVRFRVGRYRGTQQFGRSEKTLVTTLLPHLQAAIRIYNRLHRLEKECAVYAGAMGQLAVATVILDKDNRVVSTNPLADRLLSESGVLAIRSGRLLLSNSKDSRELERRLSKIRNTYDVSGEKADGQQASNTVAVEALRISRCGTYPDLGLVIRRLPASEGMDGQSTPTTAIFISDPTTTSTAPSEVIASLFDLTPAESALAVLLTNGLSLEEASQALSVSMNTTRTHLRALFAKTGVNRQANLVRLILKSVASLA